MFISEDLIGQKINCTMFSGERRQGKLVSIDKTAGTFIINWKKDQDDDYFFRTELRIDRLESLTEIIHPKASGGKSKEKSLNGSS